MMPGKQKPPKRDRRLREMVYDFESGDFTSPEQMEKRIRAWACSRAPKKLTTLQSNRWIEGFNKAIDEFKARLRGA